MMVITIERHFKNNITRLCKKKSSSVPIKHIIAINLYKLKNNLYIYIICVDVNCIGKHM